MCHMCHMCQRIRAEPCHAQVNAELIVTFEGTTEFGNPFMARQSYLPTEIHWGHKFVPILSKPPPGQTRYQVDISRQAPSYSQAFLEGQV